MELWFTDRPAAEAGRDKLRAWLQELLRSRIAGWEDTLLAEHVVVMPPPPAFGIMKGQV